jgi:PPM family protein phosphatase
VPAAYGLSDLGCVRKNNEDTLLIDPVLGLYLVADGMGGAQAGEEASRLAVETVAESVAVALRNDDQALVQAFQRANRRVIERAHADLSLDGMGTTLVGILDDGGVAHVASVGDSRAYLYESGILSLLTDDQTWVNEVGRVLGMDDQTLRTHPMRHVLTMAIGVTDELRVQTYRLNPRPGWQLLLCSDGLHGVVEAESIKNILAGPITLDAKCHSLIEAAKAAGGPDNVTAVLLAW